MAGDDKFVKFLPATSTADKGAQLLDWREGNSERLWETYRRWKDLTVKRVKSKIYVRARMGTVLRQPY